MCMNVSLSSQQITVYCIPECRCTNTFYHQYTFARTGQTDTYFTSSNSNCIQIPYYMLEYNILSEVQFGIQCNWVLKYVSSSSIHATVVFSIMGRIEKKNTHMKP